MGRPSHAVEALRTSTRVEHRFGVALHDMRKARRLTLQRAAEAMYPCTGAHLSDIECGKRQPSLTLLERIACAYGQPFDDLVARLLVVLRAREAAQRARAETIQHQHQRMRRTA